MPALSFHVVTGSGTKNIPTGNGRTRVQAGDEARGDRGSSRRRSIELAVGGMPTVPHFRGEEAFFFHGTPYGPRSTNG